MSETFLQETPEDIFLYLEMIEEDMASATAGAKSNASRGTTVPFMVIVGTDGREGIIERRENPN
jgi:hypothetical protein